MMTDSGKGSQRAHFPVGEEAENGGVYGGRRAAHRGAFGRLHLHRRQGECGACRALWNSRGGGRPSPAHPAIRMLPSGASWKSLRTGTRTMCGRCCSKGWTTRRAFYGAQRGSTLTKENLMSFQSKTDGPAQSVVGRAELPTRRAPRKTRSGVALHGGQR